MATTKKPSYITVKEQSLESLIESAKGNAVGSRKVKNTSKTTWAQTLLYIHNIKPLETFNSELEEPKIAEEVRQVFKDQFIEDRVEIYGELTEESEGRNARTGKMVPILDKNGDPIWSSWEETKLPIAYCGDIAKAIRAKVTSEVIQSTTKVLSRGDTLTLAKQPESPLDTIKRCAELIDKKATELPIDDFVDALNALESSRKALAEAMDNLKAA